MIRSLALVFPLVATLALGAGIGGCASDTDDAGSPAAVAEVNATQPITLQNFLNHPTIKAIRADVAAIEALPLTKTENPGCDGTNTKFTQGDKIRKLVEIGGEGGFSGDEIAYYRDNGKLLFIFDKETDHTGGNDVVTEKRVYFNDAGAILFQVVRTASAPNAADRIPEAGQAFAVSIENDPAAWFAVTGCGTGER